MKKIPENRLQAFRTMCKMNAWRPNELMTYLLENAIEQNEKLALPLHIWRRRRATSEHRWKNPFEEEL